MTINFISDLHLDKSRPYINEYFVKYLNNLDKSVTDLYILGDLFEYWVGDDDPMDGLEEVRETVTLLGKRINIWYMHGNRDFLVTEKDLQESKYQSTGRSYNFRVERHENIAITRRYLVYGRSRISRF